MAVVMRLISLILIVTALMLLGADAVTSLERGGDLTVRSLGTIWGFRYDRAARKVTAEGTLLAQHENIFSFAEDGDGELYALTQNGTIYSITVP